jgi:hypothetical protein
MLTEYREKTSKSNCVVKLKYINDQIMEGVGSSLPGCSNMYQYPNMISPSVITALLTIRKCLYQDTVTEISSTSLR